MCSCCTLTNVLGFAVKVLQQMRELYTLMACFNTDHFMVTIFITLLYLFCAFSCRLSFFKYQNKTHALNIYIYSQFIQITFLYFQSYKLFKVSIDNVSLNGEIWVLHPRQVSLETVLFIKLELVYQLSMYRTTSLKYSVSSFSA